MTTFAHISPIPHLQELVSGRSFHLTLAHLVETSPEYTQFYVDQKAKNPSMINILDNSAFEKFKAGEPMYPSENLLEMGKRIQADYIVMSDYPGEHSSRTIEAAKELAPKFHSEGFGTFFVPQSNIGDIADLIHSYQWAADNPQLINYIGVSILGVPNAYGVERDNKLQRFMSRWKLMGELKVLGILDKIKKNGQKIHFLGMVDGPNEIELVREFLPYIDTWDSSAGVWTGLNDIRFDSSPTGLIGGKFEKEVDFDFFTPDKALVALAKENMKHIDDLLKSRAANGVPYARNEGRIIDDFRHYVDSTYNAHYAGSNGVQVTDIWEAQGIAKHAYMSNISKYAFRFGRKEGENIKDVFKIMHYCVLLLNEIQKGKK